MQNMCSTIGIDWNLSCPPPLSPGNADGWECSSCVPEVDVSPLSKAKAPFMAGVTKQGSQLWMFLQ